jgi:hypothetical protein
MGGVSGRGWVFLFAGLLGAVVGAVAVTPLASWAYSAGNDGPLAGGDQVGFAAFIHVLGAIVGSLLLMGLAYACLTSPARRWVVVRGVAVGAAIGLALSFLVTMKFVINERPETSPEFWDFMLVMNGVYGALGALGGLVFGAIHAAGVSEGPSNSGPGPTDDSPPALPTAPEERVQEGRQRHV